MLWKVTSRLFKTVAGLNIRRNVHRRCARVIYLFTCERLHTVGLPINFSVFTNVSSGIKKSRGTILRVALGARELTAARLL